MDNASLVSIITPAYNAAAFVEKMVQSVQAQDYKNWELLITDDCSKDNTREIISGLSLADPRIRLIRQPENGGPAAARNASVAAAAGRYIAFLDSDDWWLPEKLSGQLRFMQHKNAALSYTSYRRVDRDGLNPGHLIIPPDSLTYSQLLKNTAIATSTVIVDRDQTGPFSLRKTYYDDFVLWLELLGRGFTAYGFTEDLMRYRVVANSVSRNKGRSAKMVWNTYRRDLNLGLPKSMWCFSQYAINALKKYRQF
ncbi:glycosyltransferase family 2 protein [Achromobacter xylosoxidans]|uniref:glycosyltransferase family 2 protein n=1 Tax=Alcaligenes xylosoxydans xylosoxydans TaxID=85698 RepID=UPI001F06F492|nr:glycosyltransferase family 2 protein [Achromobacter xylosoxidans]MCH1987043.1 glycosyltransferase [Achromobacter xylosoxidans]MCH4584937.1 glycosyltransferase [Achromobacter xylosoxidans]